MIDHITLNVANFDAACTFHTATLAPIGAQLLHKVPLEFTDGSDVAGFGQTRPTFWIAEGAAQTPPVHVAFVAEARAQVDAFYAAALAAGGADNGAPGLRPQYHGDYYGAFVRDPDGNNIELVCHTAP